MKIACLGWGSLVWDPKGLPMRKPWFKDGPLLPIEFLRKSKGDRITLVIDRSAVHVRSLWALMSVIELETAKLELANREGIKKENTCKYIGYWSRDENSNLNFASEIGDWAALKGLDAVVWTALPPRFYDQNGKVPSVEEVLSFLCSLPHEKRRNAEEYIRKAPIQIDTNYRRIIEKELNWTPLANY